MRLRRRARARDRRGRRSARGRGRALGPTRRRDGKVVCIVSGGNIDPRVLSRGSSSARPREARLRAPAAATAAARHPWPATSTATGRPGACASAAEPATDVCAAGARRAERDRDVERQLGVELRRRRRVAHCCDRATEVIRKGEGRTPRSPGMELTLQRKRRRSSPKVLRKPVAQVGVARAPVPDPGRTRQRWSERQSEWQT